MSDSDRVVLKNIEKALARARSLLEDGNYDEAETLYNEIRAERPDRWEGHMGVGHVHAARGDAAAALAELPKAIQADERCMPAYLLLAQMGISGGVSDIAIEWLEYGAVRMPNEPVLFEWLVCLYAIEGRVDDLRNCLWHYSQLRNLAMTDAALMFSRDPRISEDLRSRIVQAAGF